MREFGAHVTCYTTSTQTASMISCGVCGSYAFGREATFDSRANTMASNKVLCSALVFSVLAVAAIVALSITIAAYNKKVMEFIDRHEKDWYNMTTETTTTTFGTNSSLVNEQVNSTSETSYHANSTVVYDQSATPVTEHQNLSVSNKTQNVQSNHTATSSAAAESSSPSSSSSSKGSDEGSASSTKNRRTRRRTTLES